MFKRFSGFTFLLMFLLLSVGLSCGGGTSNSGIFRIVITNCPNTLLPGEDYTLTVEARMTTGAVIPGVSFTYDSSNSRFASVDGAGVVTGLYPGGVVITASASGITSDACDINVDPLPNTGTVMNISNSAVDDDWGMNNTWKMISRGRVFWQSDGTTLLIHDVADPVGTNTTIKSGILVDLDFLALGSGAGDNDIMGAWRENNMTSYVTDSINPPTNLGSQEQEENTIDSGCFMFRMNTVQDILRYTFADGLSTAASTGILGNPITSNCQAIWLEEVGLGNFDLIYWDGSSSTPIATAPFSQGQYDFRNGRIVYSKDSDIYLYDTTAANPQPVNITNRPQDLNLFVKTDGDSIIFTRTVNGGVDNDVVLYDIASQTQSIISTTDFPKEGRSLDIDLKQAVWREGNDLYFHDGTGLPSGTSLVPLGVAVLNLGFNPYISDGVVTWIGTFGDNDVYVMQ